jgi:hypothetical protein
VRGDSEAEQGKEEIISTYLVVNFLRATRAFLPAICIILYQIGTLFTPYTYKNLSSERVRHWASARASGRGEESLNKNVTGST